jgi:hypothetical protein
MTSKRTIRIGLGALAATLALAASVLADAPADASTAAAQGPTTSCNGSSVCSYDSGWMTYGDGGCEVDTTVGYLTGYDQITVGVQVKSPYWFASCTAYSTVHLGLLGAPAVSVGPFWGFACAVLDPTCSDPQTTWYARVSAGLSDSDWVVSLSVSDT